MVVSRTNERAFVQMSLHVQEQPAEGSPVTDFSSGTGAMVWARSVNLTEGTEEDNFQGSSGSAFEHVDGMIDMHRKPQIEIQFYPTPTIIKEFLKSNGNFAAADHTFTLDIPRWYSFLFTEVPVGNAGARMFRFEDCWVQSLEFDVGGFGVAICRAVVLAQKVTEVASDDVSYSADTKPNDTTQFAHRNALLSGGIGGGPTVELAIKQFTLRLAFQFTHEPFNEEWAKITKQGPLEATGTLISRYMDETMTVRQDALARTLVAYTHQLTAGGLFLKFVLRRMKWLPAPHGYENRDVIDFNQTFRVGTEDFAEQSVAIEVT
jgi:hypothetical protein